MTQRTPVPEWLLLRAVEQVRVLGQVVRLRLLEQLFEGTRTPQELADALGLTQQNVSKHLQVLNSTGLVTRRRDGARVLYALADVGIVEMLDRLAARVSVQLLELSGVAGVTGVSESHDAAGGGDARQ